MGGIYETERMLKHIEQCAMCKTATKFADRCDVWSDMYQNVPLWSSATTGLLFG